MKKLNKKSFLIAAVALLLGGGAYLNYRMATAPVDGMSDLTLANMEAMSAISDAGGVVLCPGGWDECATNGTITLFKEKKPKS